MDANDRRIAAAPHRQARPLFSIVTAVLNGASTLESTIASVHRQTFRDFEYIIIDGGSTDSTIEILKRWNSSISCWISEHDTGIYAAWNKALALSQGAWISFLGADDAYCEDALEQYARAIAMPPPEGTQFISSRVDLVTEGRVVRTVGSPWSWPAFSRYMTAAHVGAMHHHSLFQQYGIFDDTYRVCGDYELLLRPRAGLRAAFLDRVTVKMRLGGISNANLHLALVEQERAKRTTGGRPAVRCALERQSAFLKARCRRLLFY